MKTVITTKFRGALLTMGLGLLSVTGFSQEHITLSLENITSTSNTIEYDLFIVNDGTTALKLSGCAYGINYDAAILNNSMPASDAFRNVQKTRSVALEGLKPMKMINTNRGNHNQMRITTTPTPYSDAPVLLSNVPYKVGHFKFENTTDWTPNSNPSLSLNEFNVPGISTSCATAYIDGATNPKGFSVAKKNLSVKVGTSPVLNPTISVAQNQANSNTNNVGTSQVENVNTGLLSSSDSKITIYPNPTQDILNIDLNSATVSNTVVKVSDLRGKVVKQIQARSEKGLNKMTISLLEVANGVYTVQVYQDNQLSFTDKLTKKD